MKKYLVLCFVFIIALTYFLQREKKTEREEYEAFLRSHPYSKLLAEGIRESGDMEEPDRPDLAFMQYYLRTMDPATKRPMPELLFEKNRETARFRDGKGLSRNAKTQATSLSTATVWEERGPSQVGGRTRAMLFDPADPTKQKVWAGGVSGGLWYTDDITNANSTWIKVDDFWDNLSIASIAADPNNDQVIYVGTGEAQLGTRGAGIWRTTDGGVNWEQIPSTVNFLQVRDIVVRDEGTASTIYAAVNPAFGLDNPPYTSGLYRSTDNGTSWTQVLPLVDGIRPNNPTDIEIGADNTIWVGTEGPYGGMKSKLYSSSTGDIGSWSTDETFATTDNYFGQIEIAISPSDANLVYALIESGGKIAAMVKSQDKGVTWSTMSFPNDLDNGIPANDFTRGQAWYDLTIAVDPTDKNKVLVGGIDLFRSTNGGGSWTQISVWHQSFSAILPAVHADQHEIIFRPGFPGEVIFGNDGGVFYCNNVNATTVNIEIDARNNNYNVTQFYSAAIHPTLPNFMLGGTQDNGTQRFTLAGFGNTAEAYGGDGGLCFIDEKEPNFQIASYVYNSFRLSINNGTSFPIPLLNDLESGNFINSGDYDSNLKILYTAKNDTEIYRVRNVTMDRPISTISIPNLGSIASVMRLSPFNTNSSDLFIGTMSGKFLRIQNANSDSPNISNITGALFPTGTISGIAFGADVNQILVTFSNYGVVSVWETRDGGATWTNKEGDLPNMPVLWAEYHPHNPDQAYIATQLGVWSCDDLTETQPKWLSTNGGLANVRTDMLRVRKSDGVIMAATHGRGVFTALIPSQLEQTITFNTLPNKTFGDQPFNLTAQASSNLPVTFSSSNPSIATINDNTLTIKAAGTVTITAYQEGNIYYKEADPVEQELVIKKSSQSITFDALPEYEIDDEPFDISAIASSGLPVSFMSDNPEVVTINGSTVTVQGLGTAIIRANQSGDDNYNSADEVTRELKIVSRIISLSGDLDFGEVDIRKSLTKTLTVSNIGTAPITITDFELPDGFSATASVSGQQILVSVKFSPTELIDYTGQIVVLSNATSGDNTFPVSGKGILITASEGDISNEVSVFPNPVGDWLILKGKSLVNTKSIQIINEKGSTTKEPVLGNLEEEKTVFVGHLSPGIYILQVPSSGTSVQKKFIKK